MGKSFADVKGGKNAGDGKDLEFLNLSKITGSVRVRLLGEIHPAYRYWIKTREGKFYPIIAKGFDSEAEEWLHIDEDPLFPIAVEWPNKVRKEFFYTINCIDRADGKLKILPLKSTIMSQIKQLANNPEYGDPTDPENGYDITIEKIKTGSQAINIKYTVLPARSNSPLTEDEKKLELYKLDDIFKPADDYEAFIREKSSIIDEFMKAMNTPSTPDYDSGENEDDIPF